MGKQCVDNGAQSFIIYLKIWGSAQWILFLHSAEIKSGKKYDASLKGHLLAPSIKMRVRNLQRLLSRTSFSNKAIAWSSPFTIVGLLPWIYSCDPFYWWVDEQDIFITREIGLGKLGCNISKNDESKRLSWLISFSFLSSLLLFLLVLPSSLMTCQTSTLMTFVDNLPLSISPFYYHLSTVETLIITFIF